MALSVKAYLLEQQEIRRFSIDEGASSNYDYLLTKIRTVFPGIRNKPLRLFWKDNDEELVTFSSHEELVEALGSMTGDVFRVFVKVLDGQGESDGSDSSSSPQPVHEGVVCDGCDVGITGTRFKCVVCPDYDLCMKCEAKGLHKEHEMLRICTPRACPWFPGPFPFPPPPHGPHHGPHHGGHHGFGPWVRGRGARFWGPRCGRGRCGGARGRCGTTSGSRCNRHAETAAQDGQEVPVGPPFLHNLGETLASFLGPMGVEVHTYADNDQGCCQGNCTCKTEDKETEGTSAESSAQDTDTPASDQDQCPPSTGPMDTTPATEDYVLVDKDKQSEATGTNTEKTDGSASRPEADPLEEAIAKMKDMGFDDDNGWLSQLIVAKEYDIGKVLDAIQFEGKK